MFLSRRYRRGPDCVSGVLKVFEVDAFDWPVLDGDSGLYDSYGRPSFGCLLNFEPDTEGIRDGKVGTSVVAVIPGPGYGIRVTHVFVVL